MIVKEQTYRASLRSHCGTYAKQIIIWQFNHPLTVPLDAGRTSYEMIKAMKEYFQTSVECS